VRLGALAGLWLALLTTPAAAAPAELPLGPRSLDERRSEARVAPGVVWTRIARDGGPWRVNVLEVTGGLRSLLSNDAVRGLERTSAMARRALVPAAVNGGFFAGDGNPVGALAVAGRVVSEPVRGRSVLLAPLDPGGRRVRVAALGYGGEAVVGDARRRLDGVDRPLGSIPACGGVGGDRPTERPDGGRVCTDSSELVAFSPAWGGRTPRLRGAVEVAVRGGGAVAAVRSGGGSAVPPGGMVLAGTGNAATMLEEAEVGVPAAARLALRLGGRALDPAAHGAIVGGGPRLLVRGRVSVAARAEGFDRLPGFVTSRHPRTLAGVTRDGRALLVTIDGRAPGWSAGATLRESALVMRSLGARDALALDGGGSTTMVVRGRVVNRPSDRGGERAVSDALAVEP
jgi:phosphodiester glycosidase